MFFSLDFRIYAFSIVCKCAIRLVHALCSSYQTHFIASYHSLRRLHTSKAKWIHTFIDCYMNAAFEHTHTRMRRYYVICVYYTIYYAIFYSFSQLAWLVFISFASSYTVARALAWQESEWVQSTVFRVRSFAVFIYWNIYILLKFIYWPNRVSSLASER